MSAVAGVASKVIGALPVVGKIAKGAWNIGKKVVGGIKSIFTGNKNRGGQHQSQAAQGGGVQGMIDQGRQFTSDMGGMINSGRQIYQGFKQGGFRGGVDAFQRQMPSMQQSIGGMIDSGRSMYQQGRDMYQQTKGVVQGGMNEIQNLMRQRRFPWMKPGAMLPGTPIMG